MISLLFRPHSRPAFQEPSSYHHNYHYHDNIIHQRQRSNEYIPPRQQAIDHFQHHRQNSDLSEQHTQEFYSRRPPLQPRPYTPREHWQNTESAPAMMKHYPHPQAPPGPGPQYGDPIFAYRDPIYPSMAGKRSVQSLSSQPGSAKVWHPTPQITGILMNSLDPVVVRFVLGVDIEHGCVMKTTVFVLFNDKKYMFYKRNGWRQQWSVREIC